MLSTNAYEGITPSRLCCCHLFLRDRVFRRTMGGRFCGPCVMRAAEQGDTETGRYDQAALRTKTLEYCTMSWLSFHGGDCVSRKT